MPKFGAFLHGLIRWFETMASIGPIDMARIVGGRLGTQSDYIVLRSGLVLRPANSDSTVYKQVLIRRQYDLGSTRTQQLRRLMEATIAAGQIPVIIDGGANVGYSSVFFSREYPRAVVIAVEPDPHSFEGLRRNSAGIENIRPVHGAIWSHDRGVTLTHGNAAAWARRVADGGVTPSHTIESLLATLPGAQLIALKLDVEGAEVEIVRQSAQTIKDCPCVLIEPHDWMLPGRGSLGPMFEILAGRQIDTIISGDILIFYDTLALDQAG